MVNCSTIMNMEKIQLQAQPRTIVGRKVKTLRQADLVPGVIYGRGFEPLNIQVPMKDFQKVYAAAGESTLVYLDVNGQKYPTIIHDVDRHPVSEAIRHADFYKVNLTEKIHAKIPFNFVGESPAVKELAGILVKNLNEIEVEGLPQDLPREINVDISKLAAFGDQILLKDLAIPGSIAIQANPNDIVALVQEPISEEELKAQLETPAAAAEEVEVIKRPGAEIEPGVEPDETEAPAEKKVEKK